MAEYFKKSEDEWINIFCDIIFICCSNNQTKL